ncbi:uncharacterized protein BX664DRAFT_318288 [Halteromyces radiatus]|uniref:uncharacterized protein n=1 Tax=Halteromyces radiatus TaxID=101107 RepID=UPI00221ECC99|nr:uncharacterized protein BX664DRAFT_318288 [Halteromyces radiatus]KAI8077704.1 hypothetical protein BX664DRAFT_318288 [Halteromyces radiatus]
MIMKTIIFIYTFTLLFFGSYARISIIPEQCIELVNEVKKYVYPVKSWTIRDFCTQCGKPIDYSIAKLFIERATRELAETTIPYIRSRAPELPKDILPEFVENVSSALEDSFSHHKDICKFAINNPLEIEKAMQIAINKAISKALPKVIPTAMGLLPTASECKKLVRIPKLIMHDVSSGKSKGGPANVRGLVQKYSRQLCKSL